MHFSILTAIAVLASSAVAAPAPANPVERCVGNGYVTFYTDGACTQNPTQAFSQSNPGCIANMGGRHSAYVQASCGLDYNMIWSPGTNCNCQDHCEGVPGQGCWNFDGKPSASSFRLQSQGCGGNNC